MPACVTPVTGQKVLPRLMRHMAPGLALPSAWRESVCAVSHLLGETRESSVVTQAPLWSAQRDWCVSPPPDCSVTANLVTSVSAHSPLGTRVMPSLHQRRSMHSCSMCGMCAGNQTYAPLKTGNWVSSRYAQAEKKTQAYLSVVTSEECYCNYQFSTSSQSLVCSC